MSNRKTERVDVGPSLTVTIHAEGPATWSGEGNMTRARAVAMVVHYRLKALERLNALCRALDAINIEPAQTEPSDPQ